MTSSTIPVSVTTTWLHFFESTTKRRQWDRLSSIWPSGSSLHHGGCQPCPWCWTSFILYVQWWWRFEGWALAINVQSDACSASRDELLWSPGQFPGDELCSLLVLSSFDRQGILHDDGGVAWMYMRNSVTSACHCDLQTLAHQCTSKDYHHSRAQ